uniref:Lectin, mannose-binding 2-like b n=1 Tax=Gasterosteus aculeatus aculeatus TaxID=481459 RepID=A0AAQ4RT35_GASAC|nr:VIP36-like protein isoform X1 [Gasterosteus aculeatus aculeatus]
MVAAVIEANLNGFGGFSFLRPMFPFKNIRELTCLFVTLCVLTSHSLADEQEFIEDFLKREYSLVKPYRGLGFSSSSQWDLMGTAMVTPDHVRLTPDLQSRQGAVWSRVPLTVRDWELKVHFKIHGQGKKNLNGDGMAIWLTRDRMQDGAVFGSMNQFTGLGVFVDTYPNAEKNLDKTQPGTQVASETSVCPTSGKRSSHYLHRFPVSPRDASSRACASCSCGASVLLLLPRPPLTSPRLPSQRTFPYVSVMLGNGTLSYDHDYHGRPTELGGCTATARNALHDTFLLLRYSKSRLTLAVDVDGKQEWVDCADITGLKLPSGFFFGASSATGDLSDNHDLISMKLFQLTVERTPEEEDEEEEVTVPRVDNMEQFRVDVQEEGMSGVQLVVTLLFSAMGLGVLAVVGVSVYGRWKENRRKRFY